MKHKPFKTIDEQIQLLKEERGLNIEDEDAAACCLSELNYYRLSGYSLTMRTGDKFYKNSSFEQIMQIYNFDKELKLMLLKYLEDIEISLRTHIAYEMGKQDMDTDGTLSYMKPENYISEEHFNNFQSIIEDEIGNSREEAFVKHHRRQYKGVFPVWALVETLSFGKASSLFESLSVNLKKDICANYYHGIRYSSVENLLEGLVVLRNICAHHARLYNRGIPFKPDFSNDEFNYLSKQGYERDSIGNRLFFRLLVIIRLHFNPDITENIISEIEVLEQKYPYVDLKHYGFKKNWKEIMRHLHALYRS